MIKIAFFDVDGTLLKMGCEEPSENTILALKKLREKGVLLCMATGRSNPAIPHFKDIEFDILLTIMKESGVKSIIWSGQYETEYSPFLARTFANNGELYY